MTVVKPRFRPCAEVLSLIRPYKPKSTSKPQTKKERKAEIQRLVKSVNEDELQGLILNSSAFSSVQNPPALYLLRAMAMAKKAKENALQKNN